jgi:predicted nucleic acid-binding protein
VIVVDASVLTEFLLGRPAAHDALESSRGWSAEPLHAPALVELETLNALRGLVRGRRIPAERAREALADLEELRLVRHPHRALLARVWALRDQLTAYDAAYVVLAEALDATLLTSDRALAARAARILAPARVRTAE